MTNADPIRIVYKFEDPFQIKDQIDKQFRQKNGMLAIMSNNESLCQIETHLVTDAMWSIQDRLCELNALIDYGFELTLKKLGNDTH